MKSRESFFVIIKQALLFGSLLILVFACNSSDKVNTEDDKPARVVNVPDFNADSAYAFVQEQVDFGPRIPNTAAHVAAGDQIELYYDGRSQGKQPNTVFNLKDVYRGQHRIQAKVIDKNGAVLKISKAVQFVIIKFSVLFKKKAAPPPPATP